MVYSKNERVEIISLYFKNNDCARMTARIFNQRHPNKHTSDVYVASLVQKFRETGSVENKKRQAVNPVRNEAIEVAVLGHVEAEHCVSTRKLSEISGVSRASCQRILKAYKYHPYKLQLVQELNEDDPDRRLQFAEEMTNRLANDPNFLYSICFSDECSFYLNGLVNRHNCRYWDDTNPRLFREAHTQNPEKLNVWAGILGNRIIGPYFLPGNLNGEMYLELLETYIYPMIVETMENDDNILEDNVWFQQDGAPPHFTVQVRQFLNANFPNQWIGRRGSIEWPPRSPDLTPLDFFSGGI